VTRARIVALLAVAGAAGLLLWITDAAAWKVVVAVLAAAAILRLGYAMISGLAQPVPEPPEVGELRKVKLTYRCTICGTEVRMTAAVAEDPEPPRHCMEDMELLTPVE
jgi:hypothetical protein